MHELSLPENAVARDVIDLKQFPGVLQANDNQIKDSSVLTP